MIAVTASAIDLGEVASRLAALEPAWVAAALALSLPVYALLAWRWRFVAQRLGATLEFSDAWADYYVGDFFNTALPFGVAGSAMRVARHAARLPPSDGGSRFGDALCALVTERIAGLAVLALAAVGSAVSLAPTHAEVAAAAIGAVAALAVLGLALAMWGRRRGRTAGGLGRSIRRALIDRGAAYLHFVCSTVVLALLVAMFYCAARAAGVALAPGRAVAVTPLILGAMVIPLSVAGWGVREAAAAALFAALGLDASAGVAVSVTFGLIGLVQTAPGAVVWLAGARGRSRGESASPWGPLAFATWMGTWAIGAALAARPSWYAVAGASALMSWLAVAGRDRAALPANLVTTARVAAVAALPWCAGALPGWGVAAWAFGCFAADGLDGWLARRRAAATAFGAAFDQDTDAFFVMMLCLLLVARGSVPAWGLVAGLWRYAYVVLIRLVPARGEAPRSRIGRHVFALLVLCLVPGLAVPAAAPPLVAVGTALVTWSFGRSLMWSLRFAPG